MATAVIIKGSLEKQSRYGLWQRRHFELHGHYLKYYQDESMESVKGMLNLGEVSDVTMEIVDFSTREIKLSGPGNKKMLQLRAFSNVAEQWVKAIGDAADVHHKSQASKSQEAQWAAASASSKLPGEGNDVSEGA